MNDPGNISCGRIHKYITKRINTLFIVYIIIRALVPVGNRRKTAGTRGDQWDSRNARRQTTDNLNFSLQPNANPDTYPPIGENGRAGGPGASRGESKRPSLGTHDCHSAHLWKKQSTARFAQRAILRHSAILKQHVNVVYDMTYNCGLLLKFKI